MIFISETAMDKLIKYNIQLYILKLQNDIPISEDGKNTYIFQLMKYF